MQIKQATMNNLDQILEILRDGRDQLASQGIDQWQGDKPNVEHVKADINHGLVHAATPYLGVIKQKFCSYFYPSVSKRIL